MKSEDKPIWVWMKTVGVAIWSGLACTLGENGQGVADLLNFAYHVHNESLQGLDLYCTDDIGASKCTFRAHLKIAD